MNRIFISHSHKDEEWKDRLMTHLGVLEKQGLLSAWDDQQIKPGDTKSDEIEKALDTADAAILLITANFLTSDFILGEEIPRMLGQRQRQGMRIFPLIVKSCAWTKVEWLKKIQARPKDGRALSGGTEYETDANLAELAVEIDNLPKPPGWREFKGEIIEERKPGQDRRTHRRLGTLSRGQTFEAGEKEIDMVNAALYLRRPLLVTGKPGTGKSSLAFAVAHELGLGSVLYWPITTRSTLQQGLYQYDAIGRLQESQLLSSEPDEKKKIPDTISCPTAFQVSSFLKVTHDGEN